MDGKYLNNSGFCLSGLRPGECKWFSFISDAIGLGSKGDGDDAKGQMGFYAGWLACFAGNGTATLPLGEVSFY